MHNSISLFTIPMVLNIHMYVHRTLENSHPVHKTVEIFLKSGQPASKYVDGVFNIIHANVYTCAGFTSILS